ncbi:hypothetical protein [Longispora albida]|uniref:DUF7779 domain-containing protein n=1 Tax=Longispora albida TaxID=203523 RepID=UPI00036B3232|nr:hypothetical protein [Longispora albida]
MSHSVNEPTLWVPGRELPSGAVHGKESLGRYLARLRELAGQPTWDAMARAAFPQAKVPGRRPRGVNSIRNWCAGRHAPADPDALARLVRYLAKRAGLADPQALAAQFRQALAALDRTPPAQPQLTPIRLGTRLPGLTGREDLIGQIAHRLAAAPLAPAIVALTGIAGVGKTSAAVEYAHRYRHGYQLVWQIPADGPGALWSGFAQLANILGVRDRAGRDSTDPVLQVHTALATRPGRWLVIIDGVPEAAAIRHVIPPVGDGHVIVTSQHPLWPDEQALPVPVLDAATAARYLTAATKDPDAGAARALAEELGGLPLALEQAAAYIRAAGESIGGYLALFRDQDARAALLAESGGTAYGKGVAAVWLVAFEHLARHEPSAVTLLRLLSCYAPDAIPYRDLLAEPAGPGAQSRALAGNPFELNNAIIALRRYSLLQQPADGLTSVHRLVQAVTLGQLTDGERAQWKAEAAELMERRNAACVSVI